jgi:hypothetical protein
MKDTLIPLGLIFLDAQGMVVNVHTMAPEPGVPDALLTRYSSARRRSMPWRSTRVLRRRTASFRVTKPTSSACWRTVNRRHEFLKPRRLGHAVPDGPEAPNSDQPGAGLEAGSAIPVPRMDSDHLVIPHT